MKAETEADKHVRRSPYEPVPSTRQGDRAMSWPRPGQSPYDVSRRTGSPTEPPPSGDEETRDQS
jgi:hypothetical protein